MSRASNRRHRVLVYSATGSKPYHLSPAEIRTKERGGLIAFHKSSQQWRELTADEEQTKLSYSATASSPATISWMEMRAYVGEFGEKARAIAAAKIDSWATVHDTKAVCIAAGRVHNAKSIESLPTDDPF